MLERLRMQEVSQIILSVPKGAIIAGTNLQEGEPVMIIDKPNTSTMNFQSHYQKAEDAQGFIGKAGITSTIEFTINDGAVLYSVWSYLHGVTEEKATTTIRGTEWLERDKNGLLRLSSDTPPKDLHLYLQVEDDLNDAQLHLLHYPEDYEVLCVEEEKKEYYAIKLINNYIGKYFVSYTYDVEGQVTKVKQIHNNIFCSLDIYYDAVDIDTDDRHVVCIHCDKVQVFTDMMIGINDSSKASFTPIVIKSIAQGEEVIKDIATITVV